jgi:hypothetical protein
MPLTGWTARLVLTATILGTGAACGNGHEGSGLGRATPSASPALGIGVSRGPAAVTAPAGWEATSSADSSGAKDPVSGDQLYLRDIDDPSRGGSLDELAQMELDSGDPGSGEERLKDVTLDGATFFHVHVPSNGIDPADADLLVTLRDGRAIVLAFHLLAANGGDANQRLIDAVTTTFRWTD